MFEHSIKVPRHYKVAANIFKTVSTEGGSVKTLLYDDKLRHFRTNVLYALITETIKHAADIDKIFEYCGVLEKESRLDPWLAKVLTAELLFGKKALPGKSKPEKTILSYKEQFEKYTNENEDTLKTEGNISFLFPDHKLISSSMAETDEGPLIPEHTRRATLVLANLFVYSVAMFTLPFVAFFGVRHILSEYYPVSSFAVTAWSVIAAVVVVNTIICVYAYKAYHEKEYDEYGNEIDQHSYEPLPPKETTEKGGLNLKQD